MRLSRGDVRTALIALVVAGVSASAPVIAHGVHARFAHRAAQARNSERLGGVPAPRYQRECKPGAVLASATLNPSNLQPTYSRAGVQKHFSCLGSITARTSGAGSYYVRFGRPRCAGACDRPGVVVTPRTTNPSYCTYESYPSGNRPDIGIFCHIETAPYSDLVVTFALLSRPR